MQTMSGPQVHLCSVGGCNKWGGHGFSTGRYVETRWWCYEHYPHKGDAQREAAAIAASLNGKSRLPG
jgi:hypothetical protein